MKTIEIELVKRWCRELSKAQEGNSCLASCGMRIAYGSILALLEFHEDVDKFEREGKRK